MNLPRSFSHSLLLPQCFVKYLPDAPGLQAFSGCLYSGWLPAAFRCIPCHCHDCGVTDSSCIPCLDALISPRFPLLLPAYGSAGTLPVPGSFLLCNPSHSISADTSHPLRLREGQFCLDSVYLIHDGSLADQRIFSQYPGSTGIAGLYRFDQHLSFRTAAQSFMGIQFHPFIQKIMAGSILTASEQRVGKANLSHCSQQLAFIMPLDGIFFSSGNILTQHTIHVAVKGCHVLCCSLSCSLRKLFLIQFHVLHPG